MKSSERKNSRKASVDWFEYVNEYPQGAVPACPRFQADVPEWTEPDMEADDDLDSLKFLGQPIWPAEENHFGYDETIGTGRGRSDSCRCSRPGTFDCSRRHINEEKIRLRKELGDAVYNEFKFDEMGEEVARSWTSAQQKKFDSFVTKNHALEGDKFLKSGEEFFKGKKTKQEIVNYYLNVYRPRRIGTLTRSGHKVLDSDDESVEANSAKSPSKRSLPQAEKKTSKSAKPRFLTGKR